MIRGQTDDAIQPTEDEYIYVFQQSELNNDELPRIGIVIEEDETGRYNLENKGQS